MANILVTIDLELQGEDGNLSRQYEYETDVVKELSEDTGFLGRILRSIQQDYLLVGK